MNYILFFLFLGLIIADFLTGKRNNQLTVPLNILAVVAVPTMSYFLSEQLAPYFAAQLLLEQYLCLRLMIARYEFLFQEETNKLGVKGSRALIGYAVFYNIVTFAFAAYTLLMVVVALGLTGGFYTVWIGLPSILIAIMALVSGDFTEFLSILGVGAGLGGMLILIVLLFLLLIGIFSFLFLAAPIVLGLRGLKGCYRELELTIIQIAGYIFFLLFPYMNLIPLIKLRIRCNRALKKQAG